MNNEDYIDRLIDAVCSKIAKLSIDICISGEIEWFFKDFQSNNYVGGLFDPYTPV